MNGRDCFCREALCITGAHLAHPLSRAPVFRRVADKNATQKVMKAGRIGLFVFGEVLVPMMNL